MRKRLTVMGLVGRGGTPPASLEGHTPAEIAAWKMEYDVMVALQHNGFATSVLEIADDLAPLREALQERQPDVVFNMLEEFQGYALFDQHVVAYLEMLRMPYTGCNPRGLVLSRDKALTKKICTYHRIAVPGFGVFPRGRAVRKAARLNYPLIVKALQEDASAGISQASIVRDDTQLAERVTFVHEQVGDDAIAEEYIEGRELYVGVLGNRQARTFPIWELELGRLPEGAPRIATQKIKFDLRYQLKYDIHSHAATDLPEALVRRIQATARRVYRLLGLSGYARADFRLRPDGRYYLLEANANPDLAHDEEFAASAEQAGLSYERLIRRIVELGRRYHRAAHRP